MTTPKSICCNVESGTVIRIAVALENTSPIGCREGSTQKSWQTTVIRFAVKSLTSLWQMVGKLPLGHDRVRSTETLEPQAQLEGQ